MDDSAREHMELLRGRVHAAREPDRRHPRVQPRRSRPGRDAPRSTATRSSHEVVGAARAARDRAARSDGAADAHANRVPAPAGADEPDRQRGEVQPGRATARSSVGARARGRRSYEFFVRDNGVGIAPEFHDRIWGLFQTLERRDKVESTGIGLSVVRKIVEAQRRTDLGRVRARRRARRSTSRGPQDAKGERDRWMSAR